MRDHLQNLSRSLLFSRQSNPTQYAIPTIGRSAGLTRRRLMRLGLWSLTPLLVNVRPIFGQGGPIEKLLDRLQEIIQSWLENLPKNAPDQATTALENAFESGVASSIRSQTTDPQLLSALNSTKLLIGSFGGAFISDLLTSSDQIESIPALLEDSADSATRKVLTAPTFRYPFAQDLEVGFDVGFPSVGTTQSVDDILHSGHLALEDLTVNWDSKFTLTAPHDRLSLDVKVKAAQFLAGNPIDFTFDETHWSVTGTFGWEHYQNGAVIDVSASLSEGNFTKLAGSAVVSLTIPLR